jgi:hypothetical protein
MNKTIKYLKTILNILITPGIKLPRQKNVPLYFGCEDHPEQIIRELNGKKTVGHFVNGKFLKIETD